MSRQFTHLRLSAGSQQNCGAKATRRYFEDNALRKRVSIRRKRGIFKSHRGGAPPPEIGPRVKTGKARKMDALLIGAPLGLGLLLALGGVMVVMSYLNQ